MNKNMLSLIVVGLAFGVVALVCLIGLVRKDQEEPLGGEILWDDFGFSALSVRRAEEVGSPEARVYARNEFRIVRERFWRGQLCRVKIPPVTILSAKSWYSAFSRDTCAG